MALLKLSGLRVSVLLLILMFIENNAKLTDSEAKSSEINVGAEMKMPPPPRKINDGAALVFADELKQIMERYLFGICPQNFKMAVGRAKNATGPACDLDTEHQDLAGRLATLALRVHTAARADCLRLGVALASTLGDLARTAADRHAFATSSTNDAKKRKLSKSQKAKQQAKQRTALAVKKKAAAAAAAAAAKMASS